MPPHTPINKTMSPREPLFVNNVVQDCMPIIEHLAGSKGIKCRIEVSDDMPVLFADRSSITQILINLLTNAIKFSGEGATVTLQVTATNYHNIFKIIDTGRGIPEDKISTLTDSFVRTEELTAAKAGAKAVIRPDGSIIGWVGGGCTLGAVKKAAAEALKTGKSKLIHIKPAALAEAEPTVKGVDVHKSGCPSGGTEEVFIEPILPKPALIVMGASSAAQALCDLGRHMGFWVTVAALADDLPDFKAADDTVEGFDFADDPRMKGAFVVVATQGKRDRDALRCALSSNAAYVAMIGSRRKAEKLKADLLAEGMAVDNLDALHYPAGLDIGAVTPDEIALSVLAEIVQDRHKADAGSKNVTARKTSLSTG